MIALAGALMVQGELAMTPEEARLYRSALAAVPRGGKYLEFGSGGSTVVAAEAALKGALGSVDVIDSSQQFYDSLVRANPVLRGAQQRGLLRFHYGDIGRTVEWGNPLDWSQRNVSTRLAQARSYVRPQGLGCCYHHDFILIDGRFRRAVGTTATRFLAPDGQLALHDAQRYIGFFTRIYALKERAGSLAIFGQLPNGRPLAAPTEEQLLDFS